MREIKWTGYNAKDLSISDRASRPGHLLPEVIPYIGLTLYLLTSSIYVFPSGLPQPGDVLLLLTIAATLMLRARAIPSYGLLNALLGLFVSWVVLVNFSWFLIIQDYQFIHRTLFYIFNVFVVLFVVSLGSHNYSALQNLIVRCAVIALIANFIYVYFFYEGASSRATGSFNNPNQMGYWALLMMTCLAVAKRRSSLNLIDIIAIMCGSYIILLSLSKAAAVSSMVFLAILILSSQWRPTTAVCLVAALAIFAVFELGTNNVVTSIRDSGPVAAMIKRLENIGQQDDDTPAGRGYDKLLHRPEYIAFGAGEGAFVRLSPRGSHQEFHSSLGTILMSYGIIGLALFSCLIGYVFLRGSFVSALYLIPIMLYGLTHMGLRQSLFWILVGLVYIDTERHRPRPGDLREGSIALAKERSP
jgi:hypothetical protein